LTDRTESLSLFEWIAIPIWLLAVLGETFADRQLANFRADPKNKGQVCQTGLWKYSRHPNYFFEWLHWWTYAAIGIGHWWGWINLLFPAAMAFFLFKLTGIPSTEEQALKSRGEAYRRYQQSTNRFFPWFPKETPL
jgi:steroid 5-alpha reductase family enzyme